MKALNSYAGQAKARAFRPGKHDCALFVAGWIKLVTGKDYARGWRSKYRSLKQGRKLLAEAGFESHISMAAQYLPEIKPAFAQVGDIAAIDENTFGIVSGERIWVLQPTELASVPLSRATRAFAVRAKQEGVNQ